MSRRRVVLFGIILVKLCVVALILILPFGLGILLAAGHGAVLLVVLAAAMTLWISKSRGKTLHPTWAKRTVAGFSHERESK